MEYHDCTPRGWGIFPEAAGRGEIIISSEGVIIICSLMRGRIKGPHPLVNPMQSDNIFITHAIKILH